MITLLVLFTVIGGVGAYKLIFDLDYLAMHDYELLAACIAVMGVLFLILLVVAIGALAVLYLP